jgi:transcriptional regulator with XRE-family HTH domain
MTQDRLASLCEVDPSLVRDWEADRAKPSAAELNALADALAVPVEALRDGQGSFGQRVALRRKQLKLTQDGLARLLGGEVGRRTIVDLERDKAWPHPRTQRAIAEKLCVPLDWLLSGEGLPETPKLAAKPDDDERFLSGVAQ